MRLVKALFVFVVTLLLVTTSWARMDNFVKQGGGDEPLLEGGVDQKGWPGGDFFPNHDPNYTIISLTNNSYGDNQAFPEGYYMKYACFNSDGSRIAVSARNQVGAVSQYYEIWVMDYDATTQTISNYQQITTNAGSSTSTDIAANTMPSWSRGNPDLLLLLESHYTTANLLKTYDFSSSTFATVYDPALDANGDDITNPGFYANHDDQFVLGSGYNSGNDRILVFDGTYPSITVSSTDKNLDPSSNYDGTRITYYSTNATYVGGSIYSELQLGIWNENVNGFGDPSTNDVPGYWAFYSGMPSNMALVSFSLIGKNPPYLTAFL